MPDRYRVLFTDLPWGNSEIERRLLSSVPADVVEAPDTSEDTLRNLAADADAIATCWAPVTEPVIAAATRCRLIARMGIGLDNIDVAAATSLGIPVTNVPDYCIHEVADHALALLLSLARNVGFYHLRTKRGEYDLRAGPTMHRVSGRTLGLFGLGRIGQAVAARAPALGLNVIAHTRSGEDHGTGCRMVDLPTLLAECDFISLHAPLTDATRHAFAMDQFQVMKPTAFLINTSRGGVVDLEALWQALQQNQIAGAGLDVFDPEPPDLSHPLFADERVIVTPHAAFVSEEALIDLRTRVAGQIGDVLAGRAPPNVVNSPKPHSR
jgi:D-3-phosphoglycerate dehydrogenase